MSTLVLRSKTLADELFDQICCLNILFYVRNMATLFDDFQLSRWDAVHEFVGIADVDNFIAVSPNNQSRLCDLRYQW